MKLFARARDVAGVDTVRLTLPPGANVAGLRRALAETVPALRPLVGGLLVAINAQYCGDAVLLEPGAEVACFPPVSGG